MNDSSPGKTALLAQVGRLTASVVTERIRPRRPTTLDDVPSSVAHLTREWLSVALCREYPGADVTGFDIGSGSAGSTSRAALTVHYNDAGVDAGLPTEVFSKATPNLTSRLITVPSAALVTEAAFYTTIEPELSIETPMGYHAAIDQRSGRSMFLLEDIARTRGATFGDPIELYIDRAKADDMVTTLASLHGSFWNSPRITDRADLGWIKTALRFQLDCNAAIGFEKRSMVGIDRAADVIPPAFHDRRHEIWPAAMRSLEIHERHPMTLLHSDVHSRNWYVTGDGRMGLCDWQLITRGFWALDLSYALTSALTVDDRRAWERDLIALYIDELAAAGGAKLSFDEAWLAYRQQVFHGLIFWLYTMGHGLFQPAMQPDPVSRINCERMATAVVELDSLDSLDETPDSASIRER